MNAHVHGLFDVLYTLLCFSDGILILNGQSVRQGLCSSNFSGKLLKLPL